MATYEVEFTYLVPEWGTVELEADNHEDAKEEALKHIEMSYPEANDVEILEIKAVA